MAILTRTVLVAAVIGLMGTTTTFAQSGNNEPSRPKFGSRSRSATKTPAQPTAPSRGQPGAAPRTVSPDDNEELVGKKSGVKFSEAFPEDITNENYPELIDSFDYPSADIAEVVKAISKLTKKNFILDSNVRGKITIMAPSQITVAEAYRAFLSALAMNGLTVVPSGKFLKIRQTRAAQRDSIETYGGAYFPNTDQMITKIIKLKYISAEDVHKTLRLLTSKDGEAFPYGETNSLIITDYGSHIERVTNILAQLDVPGFEEQLAVIRIRHAKAKDIASLLTQIIDKDSGGSGKSSRFRSSVSRFRKSSDEAQGKSGAESFSLVVPDERTNAIIVVGNKAGIAKIRSLVRRLDFKLRPEDAGGVYVYYVRHGEAEKIANVLNGVASDSKALQEKGGAPTRSSPQTPISSSGGGDSQAVFGGDVKLSADKDTNSLIVTASKQDYDVVKSLLAKIDIPRDQVFVKAIIMELSAQKDTNWGINYYKFAGDSRGIGRVGFRSGSLDDIINPTTDSGAIFGFSNNEEMAIEISGQTFNITSLAGLVKFLKSNVGGNVLQTPQLLALDNEEATIEVGQTVPVGRKDTVSSGGATTSSIDRQKATVKLAITPFISPDTDSVRMKIEQTISQLTNEKVVAKDLADSAVVTSDRAIQTTIVIDSGDTAVLGGLMEDKESESVTKVPILGDIPILGWLFKGKNIAKSKKNLLVFISPKIIRNSQDNADLLKTKLNERIDFIQRNLNGRDPHGETIDNLPRKIFSEQDSTDVLEEPVTETF